MQVSEGQLRCWRHDTSNEGFTLIEVLIAIVVVAILAGIVVFAVQSLSGQSAETACQSDFKTVENAVESIQGRDGKSAGWYAHSRIRQPNRY